MRNLFIILFSIFLFGLSGQPSITEREESESNDLIKMRKRMVDSQLVSRGIRDKRVLEAMGKIPRHLFVDPSLQDISYGDHPLPIDEGQTISQPYIVAWMTEALKLKSTDNVLEIGTGSGYQAAVLGEIVEKVYTIEIKEKLKVQAARLLLNLGYENIETMYGDGYFGWEEKAPFDAIIITASANHIPPPLIKQLKDGGRLIIPLGSTLYYQTLTIVTRKGDTLDVEQMGGVAFVPMTGEMRK